MMDSGQKAKDRVSKFVGGLTGPHVQDDPVEEKTIGFDMDYSGSDPWSMTRPGSANDSRGKKAGNRHRTMMQAIQKASSEQEDAMEELGGFWLSSKWRQILAQIVASALFDAIMATVVAINLITMALEPEMPDARSFFTSLDWVYNVIYTIEVTMRLLVYGHVYFYHSFNILDLTIVISGWITSLAEVIAGDQDAGLDAIGALKVLRALRSLRLFRMISFFEGVWIVFSSFLNCIKPLMWTIIFLMVIIFIFAMFAVELIGTSKSLEGVEEAGLFKSTFPAMITLFQIMTLDDWRAISKPICKEEWWTYVFFFAYVCVSALALMNMVTAVVVENSMEHMNHDEDTLKQQALVENMREKDTITGLLQCFRNESNADANAYDLSAKPADLLKARTTWAALEEILDALDLHKEDEVMRLMVLLDADGNGDISVAELLEGLLELRVMTMDKHRVALLHAMDSADVQDYKFNIIERSLASTHASMDMAASLHRIEDMLLDLGVLPPKARNSHGSLPDPNDRPSSPESVPLSDAVPLEPAEVSPPGLPLKVAAPGAIESRPETPLGGVSSDLRIAGQANSRPTNGSSLREDGTDSAGAKQVVQELRAFRQALQNQGDQLEQQAASIQRMQEAVLRLREEQEDAQARRQGRSGVSWTITP